MLSWFARSFCLFLLVASSSPGGPLLGPVALAPPDILSRLVDSQSAPGPATASGSGLRRFLPGPAILATLCGQILQQGTNSHNSPTQLEASLRGHQVKGSHGLGPGYSTNLERSHGSSPQGWHSEQGVHFSFTLTGWLVTTFYRSDVVLVDWIFNDTCYRRLLLSPRPQPKVASLPHAPETSRRERGCLETRAGLKWQRGVTDHRPAPRSSCNPASASEPRARHHLFQEAALAGRQSSPRWEAGHRHSVTAPPASVGWHAAGH